MTVEYLKTITRYSQLLALWPLRGPHKKVVYFLHSALINSVTCLIAFNSIGLVLQICLHYHDMENISTVIDFGTLYLSAVFRCIYVNVNGPRLLRLVDKMYSTFIDESLNPGTSKLTMVTFQGINWKVSGTYFIGSMMFAVQNAVGPFVKYFSSANATQIPFIFEVWFPVDLSTEPAHSFIFSLQSISWLSLAYIYLIMDVFWYSVIVLSIGQMCLVAHSFRNIAPKDEDELSVSFRSCFASCVRQHQLLRSFINDIEGLLNPIVIVDFMHGIISITFILLDMTIAMSDADWTRFATMVEYFMVSVVHMFYFNYLGNELAQQEEELAKALYDVPWYLDCKNMVRPLVITTAAARKPNRLTGGKFFYLTNEFFVGAMRTIFSYFMVLQQLHNESK